MIRAAMNFFDEFRRERVTSAVIQFKQINILIPRNEWNT